MAHKVVVLSRLYPSSAYPGLGPFVRDEVNELAKRNTMAVVSPLAWRSPLLSEAGRRVAAVPHAATEYGVQVVRPRLPGIPIGGRVIEPWMWALHLRPLLRRVFQEIDADLVHAHFGLPDGFAASHFASREDVPFVLTIWGSDVHVLGRQRVSRGFLKRTFGRAQAIIAVSAELAERAWELGARPEKMVVIPGGVPYLPREPRESARKLLGISANSICVLWVGGLVQVKQPLEAIRAFIDFVAHTDKSSSFAMIGDGPLRAKVAQFVRDHGFEEQVRLLGHLGREEVWRWQCAADVLVNSSRSEGTPLSVLEALGAGTPVASYPLPGVRAVVDAVSGGATAENRTPQALAAAIEAALAKPRDREAVATDARDRFASARTAREVENVYNAVS